MDEKGAEAGAFIRANPGTFAINTLERIGRFWLVGRNGIIYLAAPLALAGLAGLWLAQRRGMNSTPVFTLILLVYPLPYYITHPDMRYQHPIEPLLTVLAAYLLCRFPSRQITA